MAKPARKSHYALYLLGLMCTTSLAFASTSIIFYVILHVRGIFSFQTDTILLITHSLYVIAIPYLIVLLVYRRRLVKSTLPVQLACSAPPVVLLFAFNVWAIIRAFTL